MAYQEVHGHHGHSSELIDHHHGGNDEEKKWIELERLYQNKSTQAKTMIEWFTQNIDKYLISPDTITQDKLISVVSFGCGDGRKDRGALRAISRSLRSKLFYCGVDPNDKAIARFRKSVDECTDGILRDVNFDLVVQTYEGYVEAKPEYRTCHNKTDLVFFVDSLCYLKLDPEEVLVDFYKHELSPQGVIVISLWNSDDFWFKIREQLSDVNNGQISDEDNGYLTVQDVKKVAEKHNWRFEMYSPNYSLDVSECFIADSELGEMMLEYLTCYSNVQSTAATDVSRGKLLEFLRREAVLNEGSRVLNGNHGILVIHK